MGPAKIEAALECTSPFWAVQKAKHRQFLEIRNTGDKYRGHPVPGVLVPQFGESKGRYIQGCYNLEF